MNQDRCPTEAAMAGPITDKRGFAARWLFSLRYCDTLLSQGLPHFKVGQRRVRINIADGDAWMNDRFGTRRRRPSAAAPLPRPQA